MQIAGWAQMEKCGLWWRGRRLLGRGRRRCCGWGGVAAEGIVAGSRARSGHNQRITGTARKPNFLVMIAEFLDAADDAFPFEFCVCPPQG